MWRGLVNWWDAVELWITQLPFPFQVALAVAVLLPLCWLAAAMVDTAVDALAGRARSMLARWHVGRPRPGPEV